MEHQIHVQIMDNHQRGNPIVTHSMSWPSLALQNNSLSHHQQFIPNQNISSNHVIHTTIWTSKGKISPTNIHLTDRKSEKTITTVKSITNKIKPLSVTKHRHRHHHQSQSRQKSSDNVPRDDFSNEDLLKSNGSLSTKDEQINVQQEFTTTKTDSIPTKIDKHFLSIDSNQRNLPNKSYQKLQKTKCVLNSNRFRLCLIFTPLAAILLAGVLTAAVITAIKLQPITTTKTISTTTTTSVTMTTITTTTSTTATTTTTTSTTSRTTSSTSTTTTTSTSSTTTSTTTTTTVTTTSTTSTTTTTTSTTTSTTTTTTTSTSTSTTSTTSTTTTTTESTTSTTSTSTSTTSTTTTSTTTTTTESTTSTTTSETTTTSTTTTTTESTTSTTSTSTSTTSTTSTTTTTSTDTTTSSTSTTTTTTSPPLNPCVSGIYWNPIGDTYAGNGTAGSALNQLNTPMGLFIDSNDTLYISDGTNCRVVSYLKNANSGTIVAGSGVCGGSLSRMSTSVRYIYVDANASVYLADYGYSRVVRWAKGANTSVIVAGNGTAGSTLNQVNYPYGIWVDSNSNVYVSELNNHRVTKWTPGATAGIVVAGVSNVSGAATDRLAGPAGLYFDESNQNLYVSNTGLSDTVIKWTIGESNGTIVGGRLGSSGSSPNTLNIPTGVTLDQWKNLYINDRSNNRIQLVCNGSNGTAITIAGRSATGTNFSLPYDVKLDSQLNLYVVDNGAHRVIKFNKL